ncbi:hypothetical protein [Haloarcula montana]|uniref:hypothetical protein n=1 Tax=Haloarcula montana TaxID=3111776 RepID=UPI002D79E0E9|nr:hypothetical protein [Haloarcula sp. GH36]
MSITSDPSYANYPDRGDNCVVCDSTIEPTKYLCSFCEAALDLAEWSALGES